jgi:hypothetical protein
MIFGHKPNGYFRTFDGHSKKIEGETHQCIHCQFTWQYKPGSGIERGYCLRHNGFLCGRPECAAMQKRLMAEIPNYQHSCITITDYNRYKLERVFMKDSRWEVKPSGVIVPVGA